MFFFIFFSAYSRWTQQLLEKISFSYRRYVIGFYGQPLQNTSAACVFIYLGIRHLVVADELRVASAGFDEVVMVTVLQDFAILKNQNIIAELQELQRHVTAISQ